MDSKYINKNTLQCTVNIYRAAFPVLLERYVDLHSDSLLTLFEVILEARYFVPLYMHGTRKTRFDSILFHPSYYACQVVYSNYCQQTLTLEVQRSPVHLINAWHTAMPIPLAYIDIADMQLFRAGIYLS